jgi:hypothetical protein
MQHATKFEQNGSVSCVQAPSSYASLLVSVSSTWVTREHSAPLRSRQVYKLRLLDLDCRICGHRRRRDPGPIGNRPREPPVHVRHCLPCCGSLHSALCDHHGNWFGGLDRVQGRTPPTAISRQRRCFGGRPRRPPARPILCNFSGSRTLQVK